MFDAPLFWILVLPGLLLGMYAQSRIRMNFMRYSQVRTVDGITGAEVARLILDLQGLQDVAVEYTPGLLSDHYDPRSKVLRLSQQVYFVPSVAAAGVAAHEAGHAVQDAKDYFPMEARSRIVPLVQLASQIAPWLFIGGVTLQSPLFIWAGVILFGSSTLFALITLPVEFNASARAERCLGTASSKSMSRSKACAGCSARLPGPTWRPPYPRSASGCSISSLCSRRRAARDGDHAMNERIAAEPTLDASKT